MFLNVDEVVNTAAGAVVGAGTVEGTVEGTGAGAHAALGLAILAGTTAERFTTTCTN